MSSAAQDQDMAIQRSFPGSKVKRERRKKENGMVK